MSEYAHMNRPGLDWLIQGLIPAGSIILLVGEPRAGKSYLALQAALAVANGTPFMGCATRKSPVLYINLDASEASWRGRLLQLERHGIQTSGPFMYHPDDELHQCDIFQPSVQRKFGDAIALCNPALIIIDVLRELHQREEKDSTHMKRVLDELTRLTGTRALLLLHHVTKISNKEFVRVIDLPRGSSYLAGKSESVWAIVDKSWHILPRFAERQVLDGEQEPSGFWRFPPPVIAP